MTEMKHPERERANSNKTGTLGAKSHFIWERSVVSGYPVFVFLTAILTTKEKGFPTSTHPEVSSQHRNTRLQTTAEPSTP